MARPLLKIEALTVSFGESPLFNGVNLSVAPGDIVSVVGASGSGKTTLLRAIAGQIPFGGSIQVLGREERFKRGDGAPAGVTLVTQEPYLWDHLPVIDNVALVRRLQQGESKVTASKRSLELLELLEVANICRRYPHSLSGGERQRVALARGLATDPALLLLDEVTSSIDLRRKKIVVQAVRRAAKGAVGVIFVTHDVFTAVDLEGRSLELTPVGLREIDLRLLIGRGA